jgi:TadE-like protein
VKRIRSHAKDETGQALVEFALVLPVLLVLLLGMLDFGKAFNYWMDATHISAEGARYAAVNRKPAPGNAASLQQQLRDQADTAELRSGGTASLPSPSQVCISFPNGTSKPGDPVEVKMTFTYHWLGFLGSHVGVTTKTVTAKSTMRLEAIPTNYSAACA